MNDMGDTWTGEVYRLTGYAYYYEREIVIIAILSTGDRWFGILLGGV